MRALFFLVLLPVCLLCAAEDIMLPPARTEGGKPLMEVMKLRRSVREFKSDALSPQTLSNLLWAAFGVNRPDGGRTAPSTHGKQEIEIYVVLSTGAYHYNAKANRLELVTKEDLRLASGTQDFVSTAPVNLLYVADMKAFEAPTPEELLQWTGADAGLIGQNVYLFCASEGLGTVIRAGFDREVLMRALKLGPKHRIVLAQTVGEIKK